MRDIEDIVSQIEKEIKEKEKRDNTYDEARAKQDLKTAVGFECYVCGTKFVTNEERKHHLKRGTHGHLYNTISPQEKEEVISLDS